MISPSLPYPGHGDLSSGKLPNGGFRIAYQDIDPQLVHYVSSITVSKGHRLVSGFFGCGLLIAGFMDRLFGFAPENFTLTAVFGLITAIILLFICFSRNVTIKQLMGILEQYVQENGYQGLTSNEVVKKELGNLTKGKYYLKIPSPFLMLKGIELTPKE